MFIIDNFKNAYSEFREDYSGAINHLGRRIERTFNGREVQDLTKTVGRFSHLSNHELEEKYKQATRQHQIAFAIVAILAAITCISLILSIGPQFPIAGLVALAAAGVGTIASYPMLIYLAKKLDIEEEAERRGLRFMDSRLARVDFING